ncbi:MAG: hypothetical protein ACRYG8_54450, partial [Janthinobacterium lividum]
DRRHMRRDDVLPMGMVLLPGLVALDRDMALQAREMAAADAREQKVALERAAANRAHQARHRAVLMMARQIADLYWPASVEMAA